MDPYTILVADDDQDLRQMVQFVLQRANMNVLLARNSEEAIELYESRPVDLVILDVMMPVMDGLDACRSIRRLSQTPVLMLTGLDGEDDSVAGFDAGADDYIVKPFRPRELVARINAILQRIQRTVPTASNGLTYGDLALDLTARRLTRRGEIISVTPLEMQLLRYFMERPGAAITKEVLFAKVWGYTMPAGGLNLIEAAIRRLREKVEDDPSTPRYIHTMRGVGYRFGA